MEKIFPRILRFTHLAFTLVSLPFRSPNFVPEFNRTLRIPNCRELLGRKFRLLWAKERDGGGIYFRVKVHMDQSQYAAVGFATRG